VISVVVPVYSGEETLGRCLDALLDQDYEGEYEIIVVDDGSTDRTRELVAKYPVKLLEQKHHGPAAARNFGARGAEGEIVVFTDADCVPEKSWLREMLRPLRDENIAGVQGAYKTDQGELTARFVQYEIEERYERMGRAEYIDFVGSYSAAYRKDIFLEEGGFDESFPMASGEDPDLSFRLASKGYKMVFNPRAVVMHRHLTTLQGYLKSKFYRAYWRVPLYRKNYGKAVSDSYTPQLLKVQIGLFYLLIASIVAAVSFGRISVLGFVLVALFASTLPLSLKILVKDWRVGVASPVILILRSSAFGLGLACAMCKNIFPLKRVE